MPRCKNGKKRLPNFGTPSDPVPAAAILSLRSGEVPIGSEVWASQMGFQFPRGEEKFRFNQGSG